MKENNIKYFKILNHYHADFSSSKFNSTADFQNSEFNSTADFLSSKFNGDTNFMSSKFREVALFGDSRFKITHFAGAHFDKVAQFDDSQFIGITSFNSSIFKEDALFENTTFEDLLYLTRTKYDKLYIRWAGIEKGLGYDESAYQQLIENFKKLGYFNDADNSYYSFRNGNRASLSFPRWQMDWILMALYGYGTRPERPIYWAIVIIVICGAVIYLTNGIQKSNDKISIPEALLYSTTALISGARSIGVFVSEPS